VIIGVGALCGAGAEAALVLQQPRPAPWLAAIVPAVALVYATTGLAAWVRRPSSRLGFLIVTGAGVWLLAGLINVDAPLLASVGFVTQTLPLGVIVLLLLAFPTGRLHHRAGRVVVAAGYAVFLLLQVPQTCSLPVDRSPSTTGPAWPRRDCRRNGFSSLPSCWPRPCCSSAACTGRTLTSAVCSRRCRCTGSSRC